MGIRACHENLTMGEYECHGMIRDERIKSYRIPWDDKR
jgi:hypothetical protein